MKKITRYINILSFSILLFCFIRCTEEETHKRGLSITLYDKPLDTIRHYVHGKWKLHYGKGGIVANMVQYYKNTYWEFDNDDGIKQIYNNDVVADTAILWYKERGAYTNGDSTYIMKFYDKWGYPWNYVINRIQQDTLIVNDFSSDAMFYHFTKQNP